MSAELVGWKLTCNGCGAWYEVKVDASLRRVREMAARVGWWADDHDVRPEFVRDFCPSCKFHNRERTNDE